MNEVVGISVGYILRWFEIGSSYPYFRGIFFTELLNKNLVDEIHLFKSKIIIGKYGKPAIVGKKLSQLNLSLNERKKFKEDIYTNYKVN